MGSIGHSLSQYEYSIIICDCGVLLMSAENSNYLVGYENLLLIFRYFM